MMDTLARTGAVHSEKVSRRIARTLLHLVRTSGCQQETGIKIDFPISRQDLAEMTGTTLYTVSRTLSKWQKLGILKTGRQSIVVINPYRLVHLQATRQGPGHRACVRLGNSGLVKRQPDGSRVDINLNRMRNA